MKKLLCIALALVMILPLAFAIPASAAPEQVADPDIKFWDRNGEVISFENGRAKINEDGSISMVTFHCTGFYIDKELSGTYTVEFEYLQQAEGYHGYPLFSTNCTDAVDAPGYGAGKGGIVMYLRNYADGYGYIPVEMFDAATASLGATGSPIVPKTRAQGYNKVKMEVVDNVAAIYINGEFHGNYPVAPQTGDNHLAFTMRHDGGPAGAALADLENSARFRNIKITSGEETKTYFETPTVAGSIDDLVFWNRNGEVISFENGRAKINDDGSISMVTFHCTGFYIDKEITGDYTVEFDYLLQTEGYHGFPLFSTNCTDAVDAPGAYGAGKNGIVMYLRNYADGYGYIPVEQFDENCTSLGATGSPIVPKTRAEGYNTVRMEVVNNVAAIYINGEFHGNYPVAPQTGDNHLAFTIRHDGGPAGAALADLENSARFKNIRITTSESTVVYLGAPAPHEHDWTVEYTWSEDGSSCTATHVCASDASHNETATGSITSEETDAPSCTENGETTYTATFAEEWATTQTKTIADVPATEHDWSVEYTWSEDGSSCTATRICGNDEQHNETATAVITSEQTNPPSETANGETTYTATFAEDWATTQTKTIADIPNTADINVLFAVASMMTMLAGAAFVIKAKKA